MTFVVVVLGIFAAYRVYYQHSPSAAEIGARFQPIYKLFLNRWYIDAIYDRAIVRPIQITGFFLNTLIERFVINGIVDGSALAVRGTGSDLRRIQSGYVRNYALSILFGAVLVVFYYVIHK